MAGACTAILAFFTSLDILVNMVSIGTLFVFYMVAQALIFRRHYSKGVNSPLPALVYLFLFTATAIGFVLFYQLKQGSWWGLVLCGLAAVVETVAFVFLCPQVFKPDSWKVPLMPWLASFSIFLNIFLLGSLDVDSYKRFGIWSAFLIALYLFYSVHASWDIEGFGEQDSGSSHDGTNFVPDVVTVEGSDLKDEEDASLVSKEEKPVDDGENAESKV